MTIDTDILTVGRLPRSFGRPVLITIEYIRPEDTIWFIDVKADRCGLYGTILIQSAAWALAWLLVY